VIRLLELSRMLVRENLYAGNFPRDPEPSPVMDTPEQVTAWHEQGSDDGSIASVYHLNALACSRLTPIGGKIVDLGCGTGQFAAYLAHRRPDLSIVGIDLSQRMVSMGNAALRDAGLATRVELRVGDMAAFADSAPEDADLVCSVFAMHHLPSPTDLTRCFSEIGDACERSGCAVWIFDLVRPRHRATAFDYPRVFTPHAPAAFKQDSINSLIAAYSNDELERALGASSLPAESMFTQRSRILPLYRAFWRKADPARALTYVYQHGNAIEQRRAHLARFVWMRYLALRWMLTKVPR
jgi:SAM-dependent methyltransferase